MNSQPSISPNTMLATFRALAIASGTLLAIGTTDAAVTVKLLTGDSNNAVHNQDATLQDLSSNGDYVLFSSGPPASGSTPGITEHGLYVRRISNNTLTFVSDTTVSQPVEASFSDDGRYVCWRGVDSNIYWRDSSIGLTRNITQGADGPSRRPVMSADGRYVAYASTARNLVSNSGKLQADGRPGVYLYDSTPQTTKVVSLGQNDAALNTGIGSAATVAAAGNEFDFSADGRFIVFSSDATNAHSARPANYPAGLLCVYRRNLATGAVDLLNRDASNKVSDGNFYTPRVSANGSRVVFFGAFVGLSLGKQMISGISNTFGIDVYAKDVAGKTVWRVSKTTDNSNPDGAYGSFLAISGDGETTSFISTGTKFVSEETDPEAGNDGTFDIFRVDLIDGGGTFTSLATKSPNNSGNVDYRVGPLLPGNGNYTAFSTSQVEAMLGTGSNDSIFFQGFSVSAPAIPSKPEISVQQPVGQELRDGAATKNFGTVPVGKSSNEVTFKIRNVGTATLSKLAIAKTGSTKGDFTVSPLSKNSLAPGASLTFKVTFKPKAKGTRTATLQIASNDGNENPFDIKLTGTGEN